ncbi:pro-neuregulin-4, membrane-bound isoform-like isoform X2 [Pocillopora damicornis]|uniref:pro-neuregulin-4, membrane-bound isoform-like isoform X2 n=1 Tax=Pocillopora damicornis TaxID=46731 RepID=UPI000F550643|nr:pro-neuregulin-4, membrane-bound isoform-like isoform X2 [Pocillopora damicornis]
MRTTLAIIFLLLAGIDYTAATKHKAAPPKEDGVPSGSSECDPPLRDDYCLNGGTCFKLPGVAGSHCVCPKGFEGKRCQDVTIDFDKSGENSN